MGIYIGVGSNVGNREENMAIAVEDLGAAILRMSSLYETEPVGYADQEWFLNAVIEIETEWDPFDLLKHCQRVENELHRERIIPKGPRTIDLDILLYHDVVIQQPELVIPHPSIAERRFVLEPLAEIAPNAIHPVHHKSIADLLRQCPDHSIVKKR